MNRVVLRDGVKASLSDIVLDTYIPFRTRPPDVFDEGGRNLYPYAVNDHLGMRRVSRRYKTVVLENAYLRLSLVPALGGKIYSCLDKLNGRDVLYVPDVIKPGLVGKTGAWVPGGIEFNFPVGHHEETVSPVDVELLDSGIGEHATVRMSRVCRRTGLRIVVITELRAGESRFFTHVRLENPTALPRDWSYWANVGIEAGDDWQFQCVGDHCLTSEPPEVLPWPIIDGEDASWYRHAWTANDRFVLGCREDYFGCYHHRSQVGFLHSAPVDCLPGKKFFTWGCRQPLHQFKTLFSDRPRNYIEVQAGAAPTQHHRAMMEPGESVTFTSLWAPFSGTGGLVWTDGDVVMGCREQHPSLYALKPLTLQFSAGAFLVKKRLQAGDRLDVKHIPADGEPCRIIIDDRVARSFAWPLVGMCDVEEVNKVSRFMRARRGDKSTPANRLAVARRQFQAGRERAGRMRLEPLSEMGRYRDEATYAYGQSCWRSGLFKEGRRALKSIQTGPWHARATELLKREETARMQFMEPVLNTQAGPARACRLADELAGRGGGKAAIPIYRKLVQQPAYAERAHYALACHALQEDRHPRRMLAHIDSLLSSGPLSRDVFVGCGELLAKSGNFARLAAMLENAPAAVRRLQWFTKYAALSAYETGHVAGAWTLLSRRRIVPWECELRWLVLYQCCALDRLRDSLQQGDLRKSWKALEYVGDYPSRLGIAEPVWPVNPTVAYWRGVCHHAAGQPREAHKAFEAGAAVPVDAERYALRLSADVSIYHAGLCAMAVSRNGQVSRSVMGRIRRSVRRCEKWYGLNPWLAGLVEELSGDYERAAARFRTVGVGIVPERRVREHIRAVEQRHCWGSI